MHTPSRMREGRQAWVCGTSASYSMASFETCPAVSRQRFAALAFEAKDVRYSVGGMANSVMAGEVINSN